MENVEYSGLLHADIEYSTKSGEVFLKMKRKDGYGPAYYVFERNLDVLSDEEKTQFEEVWNLITTSACALEIKLFDSQEIMDALQVKIKEILESEDAKLAMAEADETGEIVLVRDIDIRLFDHGTRKVTGLTLGVSVPAGASKALRTSQKP